MSITKTLAVAAALLVGASALALAQQGAPGSPTNNAAASGGPGTHQGATRSGSASKSQKVYKNQNGYQPGHQ